MDNKLPSWLNIHLNLFSRQNMHHAFLISGRKGLGKNQLILHLSSLVLCYSDKDEVCGECHSCKLSSLARKYREISCKRFGFPSTIPSSTKTNALVLLPSRCGCRISANVSFLVENESRVKNTLCEQSKRMFLRM